MVEPHDTPGDEDEDLVPAPQEGAEALSAWGGWVFGPMAWALHQGIGYAMVPWLCDLGSRWPYHALTVFSVALCGLGALTARHALRTSAHVRPARSRDRLRMMAWVGLMMSLTAFGGIAVEYLPSFWLDICTAVD